MFRSSESIPPGSNFEEHLLSAVEHCEVIIAVIGPRWLSIRGPSGRRRLLEADDWVRRELASGFARGKRVIPVLLSGTAPPAENDLPRDIAMLSRCQYRRVSHRQFGSDMWQLVNDLRRLLLTAA